MRTIKRVVRRLAPGQIDELVQAYEAGATLSDLSEQFGQTRKTLSRALERRGVARRYRLMPEDGVSEAREAYESGRTLSEIGKELGLSRDTVRRALLKDGVAMRSGRFG